MGLFDRLKGGKEKKPPEDEDELSGIIDNAANEALSEMDISDEGDNVSGEAEKQIEEGFDDESKKEIEEGVKKEMESGKTEKEMEKEIEKEIKKKFGFPGDI